MFLLSWKEFLCTELLVVVDEINRFSSQRQRGREGRGYGGKGEQAALKGIAMQAFLSQNGSVVKLNNKILSVLEM